MATVHLLTAAIFSISTATAAFAQSTATGTTTTTTTTTTPAAAPDLKTSMEALKGALAASKLMTVDSIEMVESNFRTELESYTSDQMTLKDIHNLELGGK